MFKYILLLFPTIAWGNFNFAKDLSLKPIDQNKFGETLTSEVFNSTGWPQELEFEEKNYQINYTFNDDLTKYVKKELRRYRSDFASVVVIDNNTGKILTAVDYTRKSRAFGKNITFSSTNPAASIFKVITAASLIENDDLKQDDVFSYNGKSTTLYKYQLKNKKTRWTRRIPFRKAFAFSNNVVFGKAAIQNSSYSEITSMANKFGFNKELLQLIDVGNSKLLNINSDYGLAELASGFNRQTMISPVHGAVIASVVANNGILRKPTLIDSVVDSKHQRQVWRPRFEIERVLTKESNQTLQDMMELTVKRGTARGAFRPWKIKRLKNINIGGKTGTITGGLPYGKRDWFVSYAVPKDSEDRGISVAVMIVNVKKWYIKSTVMAKKVINHYYTKIKS